MTMTTFAEIQIKCAKQIGDGFFFGIPMILNQQEWVTNESKPNIITSRKGLFSQMYTLIYEILSGNDTNILHLAHLLWLKQNMNVKWSWYQW